MKHHYKRVNYIYSSRDNVVVLKDTEFKMIKDYILLLEGELHNANGRTFKDIPTELLEMLGEKNFNRFYKNT